MDIKTKRIILFSLYGVITLSFAFSLLFINKFIESHDKKDYPTVETVLKPTNNVVDNSAVAVFSEPTLISKPYDDNKVNVEISFYDSTQSSQNQETSLIYYENTYMPSTGVLYTNDEIFNILSIYDGIIDNIEDNEILGKTIKVKYNNNLIGSYECVNDVKVNVGDTVKNGQVIGTSGTCNVFKEKKNNLYFELINDGKNINPEYYYGKTIEEF